MRSSADDERTNAATTTHNGNAFWAFVNWLRQGYAGDAPVTGHCSLIALHGPTSTSEQRISAHPPATAWISPEQSDQAHRP